MSPLCAQWLQSDVALHWKNIMNDGGGRRGPSHSLLLLCGAALLVIPRLLQAEYGCSGIPWRHAPGGCRGYCEWCKMGVASGTTCSVYIRAGWRARWAAAVLRSGARLQSSARLNGSDTSQTRLTVRGRYYCFFLFFFFKILDTRFSLNMAVTEAGCDLTYCKMRGIVAVLTGEQTKIIQISQNIFITRAACVLISETN